MPKHLNSVNLSFAPSACVCVCVVRPSGGRHEEKKYLNNCFLVLENQGLRRSCLFCKPRCFCVGLDQQEAILKAAEQSPEIAANQRLSHFQMYRLLSTWPTFWAALLTAPWLKMSRGWRGPLEAITESSEWVFNTSCESANCAFTGLASKMKLTYIRFAWHSLEEEHLKVEARENNIFSNSKTVVEMGENSLLAFFAQPVAPFKLHTLHLDAQSLETRLFGASVNSATSRLCPIFHKHPT